MKVRRAKSIYKLRDGILSGFSSYPDHYKDDIYILPDGVQIIGTHAFGGSSAAAFILPDGLTKIHARAFSNCAFLEMIYIPASVEVVELDAIVGCRKLTVYCEDEPKEGWINGEPYEIEDEITTDDDYAFDFHRGGVSTTKVTIKVTNNWNPDKRPVVCHCSREDFLKRIAELTRRK